MVHPQDAGRLPIEVPITTAVRSGGSAAPAEPTAWAAAARAYCAKGSVRRASFGSPMKAPRSKASETGDHQCGPVDPSSGTVCMPKVPFTRFVQKCSGETPMADTTPMPVIAMSRT